MRLEYEDDRGGRSTIVADDADAFEVDAGIERVYEREVACGPAKGRDALLRLNSRGSSRGVIKAAGAYSG